jgi:glycine/D-amino acid oxidase-like deaminating enzyme
MGARAINVVGGGVFGAAASISLRRRGFGVRLIDPGPLPHPDASSTDISKAVRADYGSDRFYADLAAGAIEGWRRWNADGRPPLYHEVGILLLSPVGFDEPGFEADCYRVLLERGVTPERLTGEALGQRFPSWAGTPYRDAYFNREAGWAESGAVVGRLIEDALELGVEVHAGSRCARLLESGSTVTGVELEDGTTLTSDLVLVAAGAWTPSLLPHLGDRLWATGQPVIHLKPSDPTRYTGERFPVWCADIAQTGWYGFPVNRDGLFKVGHHGAGTRWQPGDPLEISDEQRERSLEFVARTFPELAGLEVHGTRLCLYCDSWDGDFLIDHDPDRPGLVVAAGGSGHGFKFAPTIGDIIADVVERRPNEAARRFRWRDKGERRLEQARQVDS